MTFLVQSLSVCIDHRENITRSQILRRPVERFIRIEPELCKYWCVRVH